MLYLSLYQLGSCLHDLSEHGLRVLVDRDLLPSLKSSSLEFFEDCLFREQHRFWFHLSTSRSKDFLELIPSGT